MIALREVISSAEGPALGLFVKIPSLEVCEIVSRAGVDFVVIDTEHALLSVRDVYSMIVTYSALGIAPLVRVTDHTYGDAQRYLDAGATGILVPHVSTADAAARVANQMLFPPLGTRGMGYASRAGQWGGLPGGSQEYLRNGQEGVVRMAMVEEAEAVDNIDSILATKGIDAVFVGPGDLSVSLGVPMGDDAVGEAVDRAVGAAVAANVLVGTVANAKNIRKLADAGCSFLMVGNDAGILRSAATSILAGHREALKTI